MTKPTFSVIIPAYNQGKYLRKTLESVLNQTFTDWECIIVNDGSTDSTPDIAQQYARNDARFICHNKANGGLSAARNAGLSLSSGQWVQFLDSDDLISIEKLERSLTVIEASPDAEIVISDFRMFAKDLTDATPAFCQLKQDLLNYDDILFRWGEFTIPIHCGVFRTTLFEKVRFNETLRSIEDWIMWLDIFKDSPTAIYLNEALAYYRINPDSMTKDRMTHRANLITAYKHIIFSLQEPYTTRFSHVIIDRLNDLLSLYENEVKLMRSSPLFHFEQKAKNVIHKLKNIGNR